MIEVYAGLPGSGKTYICVSRIYHWLQKGFDVYSNIVVDLNKWNLKSTHGKFHYINFFTNPEELLYIYDGKVIIDEIQVVFNSKGWAKLYAQNPEIIFKFQVARHCSVDIEATAQDFDNINTDIRRITQTIYRLNRVGKFIISRDYPKEAVNSKKARFIIPDIHVINKKIYSAYNTKAWLAHMDKSFPKKTYPFATCSCIGHLKKF